MQLPHRRRALHALQALAAATLVLASTLLTPAAQAAGGTGEPGPYAAIVTSWPSTLIPLGPGAYISNQKLETMTFTGTAVVGRGCGGVVAVGLRNPGPQPLLSGMVHSGGNPDYDWYQPYSVQIQGGTWQLHVPFPNLAYQDGTYDLQFVQYCNGVYYGTLVTYTLDTQVLPPVVSSSVTADQDSTIITGTGEPGATVHVKAGAWGEVTATVAADGTWSVDYPHLFPVGTTTITAYQVDLATNVSEPGTADVTIVAPPDDPEDPVDPPTDPPTDPPVPARPPTAVVKPVKHHRPPAITTGYAETVPSSSRRSPIALGLGVAGLVTVLGGALLLRRRRTS
ncbi:MAG: hypothetical protein J7518_21125 [Nocardioidaceae bacterium]|nr:hypothetical protein [Nocardioidaceae bacterium]